MMLSHKIIITFNQIYSIIPMNKIIRELIWICAGEIGVGSQSRGREREKECSRLMEWVTEHWLQIEMAWVRNGHYWNWTPKYFYQHKSIGQINCQSNWVGLKFFSFTRATTLVLMMTCFATIISMFLNVSTHFIYVC